ncbi:MAG: sugar transferase [Acidobacteria bacterium]|nr:sugar transferase [Acidobacteriota bacterium]
MNSEESVRVSATFWARYAKRPFDVVIAAALLVALSPLLILAGLLVKLTSRGPLLFSQERSGRDGVLFRLRKFRTMHGHHTPDPKELVPLDHPEITPAGRVLRRYKIDELPQLFNVICGDMSLVGPRPTLPDQVERYDAFRRQRLLVRPGITGLAQVNTNATVPWDERILFDIAYVRRCGLLLDLAVLARTIWVLIAGETDAIQAFESTRFAPYVEVPGDYRESS